MRRPGAELWSWVGGLLIFFLFARLPLVSALLPVVCWLIAFALWQPESFLGDPGRLHHLGITYGQFLTIALGLLATRLYRREPAPLVLSGVIFCSVVAPAFGLTLLT